MNTISRDYIKKVRNLGHRQDCYREYGDAEDMRRLRCAKVLADERGLDTSRMTNMIEYVKYLMEEHEDTSKALYEYAGILSRLKECREKMIPHKRDTEIIDYILTGWIKK
jgi:hypothetical protein